MVSELKASLEIIEFVYGEHVTIVGGANRREPVPANSIVVRLNDHWLYQGGEAHIFYVSCAQDQQINKLAAHWSVYPDKIPQFVIGNSGIGAARQNELLQKFCEKHTIPFIAPSHDQHLDTSPAGPLNEWLNCFRKELGTHPFVGMIAAKHLSMLPVREVFFTGFDFYHDGKDFPKKINVHDIPPQVAWFRKLLKTDARMKVDKRLEAIL